MDRNVKIVPTRATKILAACAVLIAVLHVGSWILFQAGVEKVRVLRLLFDMRDEGNVFQFFAAMLFVVSAVCMLFNRWTTLKAGRERTFWTILALIFLFLAFDEAGQVHEKFNKPVRRLLGDGDLGALNYPWLLPYAIALLVLGASMWRGFLQLDGWTRGRMVLSGVIFLSGAMGMELVEASFANEGVEHAGADMLIYTTEECIEMAALILLIHTLLMRLSRKSAAIGLSFEQEGRQPRPAIFGSTLEHGSTEHGTIERATAAGRPTAGL